MPKDCEYPGKALDNKGVLHSGVLMQETCRWESFLGKTADAARAAAVARCGPPEAIAARACMSYTTGRGTNQFKINVNKASRLGGDYHDILKANKARQFSVPFYDVLIMTLPVGSRVRQPAIQSVHSNWTTSYRPGRILNEL